MPVSAEIISYEISRVTYNLHKLGNWSTGSKTSWSHLTTDDRSGLGPLMCFQSNSSSIAAFFYKINLIFKKQIKLTQHCCEQVCIYFVHFQVAAVTSDRGARDPRIEPGDGWMFAFSTKTTAIHHFGQGRLSLLPSVEWLNEPYGWVMIQMATGKCLAYGTLQADSKVMSATWPKSWQRPISLCCTRLCSA